jgi:hypothetical protein
LLWLSGDWRWVEGWIFGSWWVSFAAATVLWLGFKDPALLAERMRMPGTGGESRADMVILFGIKVGFLALIFVPALNVRFAWTPRLPLWCEVCGGILLLGGSYPFFRAFTDNPPSIRQVSALSGSLGRIVADSEIARIPRVENEIGRGASDRRSAC